MSGYDVRSCSGKWTCHSSEQKLHLFKDRTAFAAKISVYSSGSQNGLCRLLGALEMGPSDTVVRLFTVEATSEQTLRNWYHFIKPIPVI
jgi:hypothetical protein